MYESMKTVEKSRKLWNDHVKIKTAEMTASSTPAPKCCRFHENDAKTMDKERFGVQNNAKYRGNSNFQVQNAANSKETGQNCKSKKYPQTEKNKIPKQSQTSL